MPGPISTTPPEEEPQSQYILLPPRGNSYAERDRQPEIDQFWWPMSEARSTTKAMRVDVDALGKMHFPEPELRVLDSINEDGPKLVSLPDQAALEIASGAVGVRLLRVRQDYTPAVSSLATTPPIPPQSGSAVWPVKVCDFQTNRPIGGAVVTVWDPHGEGDQQITDASGLARLRLPAGTTMLDKWVVTAPLSGCWGQLIRAVPINLSVPGSCLLQPVSPLHKAAQSHYYSMGSNPGDGQNVKVAVVDTGVDLHHGSLAVSIGENTVSGEPLQDVDDNGLGHGTHVAGLISAIAAINSLATGATVQSWRVFAKGSSFATNYSILKALMHVIRCRDFDIVNLSLSNSSLSGYDQALADAIEDAANTGILVIAAAGNDGKGQVSPLARLVAMHGLVVGAIGRRGTYPAGSPHEEDETSNPTGTDPKDYVAGFSNYGNDVSLVAPGSAIVSTIPGGGYGVMSGTSMACPIVSAIAAKTLADNLHQSVLQQRDRNRTNHLIQLVKNKTRQLGFGFMYEGAGLAMP